MILDYIVGKYEALIVGNQPHVHEKNWYFPIYNPYREMPLLYVFQRLLNLNQFAT